MELIKKLFYFMIVFMFLFSSVFLFMPMAAKESIAGNQNVFFALGIMFWFGFLSSYIILFIINSNRRKNTTTKKGIKHIGFFKINSNIIALIFDVIFLISFISVIIMLLFSYNGYILYIAVFLFVFSLHMHSIFNGQNFEYIFLNKNGGSINE
jgi:hypothetical protein